MKAKLFTFLIALLMMLTFNSCETYTYATTQDDIYIEAEADVVRSNVSFDVIIKYGIPYYRDGVLLYYLYRDLYYYPFYYNDYWYVRAYRRPFTHFDHRPYFRPHRYDYKFSPGSYRGFNRPRVSNGHFRNNGNYRRPQGNRPDVQPNYPNPNSRVTPQRPMNIPNRGMNQPNRPNTRMQAPTRPINTPNRGMSQPGRSGSNRR